MCVWWYEYDIYSIEKGFDIKSITGQSLLGSGWVGISFFFLFLSISDICWNIASPINCNFIASTFIHSRTFTTYPRYAYWSQQPQGSYQCWGRLSCWLTALIIVSTFFAYVLSCPFPPIRSDYSRHSESPLPHSCRLWWHHFAHHNTTE